MGGLLTLHLTGTMVMIYPKPDFVPAIFTVLNFIVDDIESAVRQLNEKGIKMEQYDLDQLKTDEMGIVRSGGPLIAWFKDPSGNIIGIIQNR